MDDSGHRAGRARAGADFLEWNFTIMANSSPWSVEQAMTQLLAHQNAEGFGPSLADAAQDDAVVIHELGQRPTPRAVAALRAFQAMSTVDTQRELARANADRLVRQGLPEPPWATHIGRVRVDSCWWAHDPFGETAIVRCVFSYDGADEHAVLAMIDRAIGDGLLRELTLTTQPGPTRDLLQHTGDGFTSEPLDPAHARRLLEDAAATTDALIDDPQYQPRPVPAAYRKMRALALARARALSATVAPPDPTPSSVEIALLKHAFLASDTAAALPATDATRQAVDLLVTHLVEQAGCHPLHLGPRTVLAALGLPELNSAHTDSPDIGQALPAVAKAWISWTATERRLPHDAAEHLEQAAHQACTALRAARER